jgi:hypothetical protein
MPPAIGPRAVDLTLARGPHTPFLDQTSDVRNVDLGPEAARPARRECLEKVVGIQ